MYAILILHCSELQKKTSSKALKLLINNLWFNFSTTPEIYTYRVLQTIEMKLILLCVWEERAVVGSAKTALKFKYEIQIG